MVPLGLKEWFIDEGVPEARVQEMDWWDDYIDGEQVTITATPSQHWSARGLFDRDKTLWAAWHIEIADFSLWFGGDTGYNQIQFKEIGEKWSDIDLGLIPIGAYAPRWFMKAQHVDPLEAIKVHNDIGAKLSIGMHWATFQLSAEPVLEPKKKIQLAVENNLIAENVFITMAIGETLHYSERDH